MDPRDYTDLISNEPPLTAVKSEMIIEPAVKSIAQLSQSIVAE
jgi:hypothetical protein